MAHLFFSSDSNSNLFLRLLTGSQITAAATFIFLDSIFLFCFIKYLTHTQVDDDSPIDPRFLIISRYGCLASTLCLLLLACSIAYNITDLVFGGVGSSLALVVLGMASGICATMVFLVLFCMKVALWWQSGKELELAKARLKKAKMESDATIFVN
ncbi:hypothetical protein BDR26DRAFT_864997 [Obelidium mucronatum]|nr:hypothetical protein BDR26DRAFT_864997 [Obelidium mucronatum]